MPKRQQYSLYHAPSKVYGTAAQDPLPEDISKPIDDDRIKQIQQVVGAVLYYARAVDLTVLVLLSSIASEPMCATEDTENHVTQLFDYIATHPNAKVRYHALDMILNIHSDASYLSDKKARSRIAGQYFLQSNPESGKPILTNGAILAFCGILKFVVASAAETELGAFCMNIANRGKL